MNWGKSGTDECWLLDPGSPLSGTGTVVNSDLAAACELAKQTIKLAGGGKIKVREFANVGQ